MIEALLATLLLDPPDDWKSSRASTSDSSPKVEPITITGPSQFIEVNVERWGDGYDGTIMLNLASVESFRRDYRRSDFNYDTGRSRDKTLVKLHNKTELRLQNYYDDILVKLGVPSHDQ